MKDFIYQYNLVSTNTVKNVYEWCDVINNKRGVQIDYENSISLINLASVFNRLYQEFLTDLSVLKPLSFLGSEVYYEHSKVWENIKIMYFQIIDPIKEIFDENWALLYSFVNNGEFHTMVTNDLHPLDEKYKRIETDYEKEMFINYMNLIEKHALFLELYEHLKNKFVLGNGTTTLFTKIEGRILEGLNTFNISFGNAYFNYEDFISIKFKLGNNLEIDYENSKVILESKEVFGNAKKEIIDKLLKELYVSLEYIKPKDVKSEEIKLIKEVKK